MSSYSGLSTITSVSSNQDDLELGHLGDMPSTLKRALRGFGRCRMIPWRGNGSATPTQMSSITLSMRCGSRLAAVNKSSQLHKISDSTKPLEQAFTHEDIVNSDLGKCTALYGMTTISLAPGRLATIGGVVLSKNKYYGLTVAHAFADACNADTTTTSSELGGNDTEFAFDEEDEEETGETSLSDVAVTSQSRWSSPISRAELIWI